jgi:hypothetical protein
VSTRQKILILTGGIAISIIIFVILCIVCIFLPPGSKITDDYRLLRRSPHDVSIGATWTDPGTAEIIGPEVVDLDWNEEFIVVKQIPWGKAVTNWYVIEIDKHRPIGPKPAPLSYDEYLELRETLGVPSDLDLLEPDQESWVAYESRRKQKK